MNIAIPARKGFKVQVLALCLAIAVFTAVTAGGAWGGIDLGGGTTAPAPRENRFAFERTYPTLVLYLVNSQEQADHLHALQALAQAELYQSGSTEPDESIIVLVADTPDKELNAAEIVDYWTSAGSSVQVIDYREVSFD